jgi:hypothetical protein
VTSVGVPLPPPFKGQNDLLPTFSLENPYCVRMQNFNTDRGVMQLRKGTKRFAQVTSGTPAALCVQGYGSKLFLLVDDSTSRLRFYEITTGTPVSVHTTGASGGGDKEVQTLFFNKYLMFFGDASLTSIGPQYYNGSAWGTLGYTFDAGFTPFGGAVYKNRAYIINRGTAQYAYTGIDAISGATTTVDLSSVISENGSLYGIKSISLSENVTQQNVLAFIFSSGEILVYGGSYPNSETWALSARLRTSGLLYTGAAIDAKGDSFLLTQSEILSLRNLIAKGSDSEAREGIGATIGTRWKQIIKALTAYGGSAITYVRGVYDDVNDRLVISLPYFVDPTTSQVQNGIHQLIYDFTLGSWFEFYQGIESGVTSMTCCITFWNGNTYILTDASDGVTEYATVHQLESTTNYLDDNIKTGTSGISYQVISAPHPLNRYGVITTAGLEVFIKSDLYSTINFRLIADLGARQTAQQKTTGDGTNLTKTFVNLGIESNLVQYEISGVSTTSSVGIEIYGTNLWVNPSEGVAR